MALATAESGTGELRRFDAEDAADPFALFRAWMSEAVVTEPNDPDAAALATASADGAPSVRMVLMKRLTSEGFTFYTNAESQKGRELRENPRAAMCFHWKTQRRQVRVQGSVRELPGKDADSYFHSRARRSQVSAAVSAQSRLLGNRQDLVRAAEVLERQFPGEVPRPDYWRGYVLEPERIEFWQEGEFRLHDRIVFWRAAGGWENGRLYP